VPELPSGTVTFLFTDVEGSTKLLHELGAEDYAQALAEHRRVLREAFTRHGGVEVDTQGDAFFVAFPTTGGALAAAAEGQQALAEGPIRVRMGIHTGTPHLAQEGYVGADVHRAARIAAAGHGGQVVVSAATASLVTTNRLCELGEHRMKDFEQAVPLYQLGEESFPPLKTISNTNLPRPASSFVGREKEVSEITFLLQNGARLLTLTGPGGTGKTRLAIEAATELVSGFKAGVFWVPLAALRESALVSDTIAHTLGAKDGLVEHIGEREMLLLLDNLEQVVDAAPVLASLVENCPNLRLLTTSRELLRVRGEVDYPVPPLADPEAVELFCARSRLEPDETIAELCRALDSLPLAVELAAARAQVLSPRQILDRLSQRLDVLKGGRDADPRQQTLRATIEWSYDLLTPEEGQLFARLSVFRGGCTLEAAEQVAEAELDTLQALVDKSLLRYRHERFWMLETIRGYAGEQLDQSCEAEELRRRHAQHYLALAERAYGERVTSSSTWVSVLNADQDNIRAALDWAAIADPHVEAQLAGAVAYYWLLRGYAPEARDRLAGALTRYVANDHIRARALTNLGDAVGDIGADREALTYLEEAVAVWRQIGDPLGEALALESIGYCRVAIGELQEARAAFEQSLALRREAGAPEIDTGQSLAGLCQVLMASGDTEHLETMANDLFDLGTRYDSQRIQQSALAYLADRALISGEFAEAERRYRRALAHARSAGISVQCPSKLIGIAMSASARGDNARAVRLAAAARAELKALGVTATNPYWERLQDRFIGAARAQLAPGELAHAELAGTQTPFDAVLDEVLGAEEK
jgi:predicted ATPase